MDLIYKAESYAVVGACFEVYNELGNGFDESIYHEALLLEFEDKQVPVESEVRLHIQYKGKQLKKYFKADLVAYQKIIIELKSVKSLNDYHRAQVINYLKATGYKLGLLINFGAPEGLEYERVVL